MKRILGFVALSIMLVLPSLGQTTFTLAETSKVWVDGTSNRSDWTVHAETIDGTVALETIPESGMPAIQSAEFRVQAGDMKSRKSSIMDRLMHGALKADEHPEITFVLTEAMPSAAEEPGSFSLTATGVLSMAGSEKPVTLALTGSMTEEGMLHVTGQHALLLSEHDMKAPTAMYGALRTGDEVIIHVDVYFAAQ